MNEIGDPRLARNLELEGRESSAGTGVFLHLESQLAARARSELQITLRCELLKDPYVTGLAHCSGCGESSLRNTVWMLLVRNVTCRTLVRWVVEAGYSTGYARGLICQILRQSGIRARKPGGGRKIAAEYLEALDARAKSILRGAYELLLAEKKHAREARGDQETAQP